MANINHKPSKYMLNLLHVLPPFTDESRKVVNAIIEINPGTINKYELITETGQLKLDRVGYSSLAFPVAYGAIPGTLDQDNDALDIQIVGTNEPLAPGCLVEARIIGIMKFTDSGEVDDKVIAVLNDDKRMDHITSIDQFGEHVKKEIQNYWEHYKDLKKMNSCLVEGFHDTEEALKIIDECTERYQKDYAHLLD
jgi:inorganic pyrophosphatase